MRRKQRSDQRRAHRPFFSDASFFSPPRMARAGQCLQIFRRPLACDGLFTMFSFDLVQHAVFVTALLFYVLDLTG
jgi:hypothetical protein